MVAGIPLNSNVTLISSCVYLLDKKILFAMLYQLQYIAVKFYITFHTQVI
jgi:hypothetical protein